jgi:hypothetical protein
LRQSVFAVLWVATVLGNIGSLVTRQHQPVSHADADIQVEVLKFHAGTERPVVHHFLALEMASAATASDRSPTRSS